MSYSTTTYPYDTVAYIIVTYPDGASFQGSGVIIGPHTVLTASHLLWDADNNEAATSVTVYPGYNLGGQAITGPWFEHYNQVDDTGDKETEATSQSDFAVIDFAANLSAYGSMGLAVGYAGGQVHMTGYPGDAGGAQTDQTGVVEASRHYSTLDYETVSSSPGDSGGPLWINAGTAGTPLPEVVGLVSTSAWGVQLTNADLATIDNWEAADAYLWTGGPTTQLATQVRTGLTGGAGNDTLTGWSGGDTMSGGPGNDSIVGGTGFNQVNGNQGADTILGHSTTGDGLLGGQGNDLIDTSGSTGANILNGNLGADTLIGGSGADTLHGGQGDDVIHAGDVNAWLSGDLGNNTLYGGQGRDSFHASAGHDTVIGWHAGDQVLADAGVAFAVTQVSADVHITFSNGAEMDLIGVQTTALRDGWIANS